MYIISQDVSGIVKRLSRDQGLEILDDLEAKSDNLLIEIKSYTIKIKNWDGKTSQRIYEALY